MSEENTDVASTQRLIKAYVKMRDARSALKAKYTEEDDKIKEQMDIIEAALMEVCKKAGGNISIPGGGRVVRGVKTQYWTSDWESMHSFIKENDAIDLLERRIAQKAMAEFLRANPDKMPPGLNADSKYVITVYRS